MKKILFVMVAMLVWAWTAGAGDVAERNKALACRTLEEMLGAGRFELQPELYSPDFVNHARNRDVTLAEDMAAARGWKQVFPDLSMKCELAVAEKDIVAVLWRATGTNTGEGNGIPATGKKVDSRGITIWRITDGRIVEEWSEFGMLDMARQVGLAPGGTDAPVQDQRSHDYLSPAKNVTVELQEQNRAAARSIFEQIVGEGKLDLFNTIYAPEYVNHGTHKDGTLQQEIEGTRAFRQLAPDIKVGIALTVAEGNSVAVLWTAEGTHTGTALGLEATGKKFHLRGASILRMDPQGKIIGEWSVLDLYYTLMELGIIPKPASRP